MRRLLARLAAGAPVPVFAATGEGAREAVRALRLRPELHLVDTPRQANVLLVAGGIGPDLLPPLLRVHDQVLEPRRTVRWPLGAAPGPERDLLPAPVAADDLDDVVAHVLRANDEVLSGRGSDPPFFPDVDPAPWRGVGPYGQGGKGMSGGTPYGRPLAERQPSRDGLALDRISVRFG
ncbi:MAG: hypothetical protein HY658_04295, partial [Actinobacteria bacterium]|nr:hypothetical protein [Actinomycetota bacterium]